MNIERILHAIEGGCNTCPELKERFGNNVLYQLKKLVKLGILSKEKGGFYKKISNLPFTNVE